MGAEAKGARMPADRRLGAMAGGPRQHCEGWAERRPYALPLFGSDFQHGEREDSVATVLFGGQSTQRNGTRSHGHSLLAKHQNKVQTQHS